MRPTRNAVAVAKVSLLLVLLALSLSCESKDRYAGMYHAADRQGEVLLELKPGGEGLWVSGMKEAPFAWYIKKGELRINTKEGGVIVGKIQGKTITVAVPGKGELVFTKAP